MNWWQIFKRELRQMFIVDRRRAVFLFGASLAYLVLFSLLYGTHTINAVPMVVYDEDQTQFSRTLIQSFDDSDRFQIISYVDSQEDMEYALREKEVFAALHIPKKFAQDAKLGRAANVMLMADGSNILVTSTVTTAAQEIVAAFSKETGAKLAETNYGQLPQKAEAKVAPVEFRLRVLNNPTQSYLSFIVLGLAMAALQQGIFLSVGGSIQYEYQNPGDLKYSNSVSLMAGKLLPYFLSGTLAFFLTAAVAITIFEIPGKAPLLDMLVLASAFNFAAANFGALLAAVANTELNFTRASIAYTVPAFVLSGYTWPQEAMDALGQTLSYVFPLTYFSNAVRELMVAGYSPSLYQNSAILLLMGLILSALAAVCYTRRLKQLAAG